MPMSPRGPRVAPSPARQGGKANPAGRRTRSDLRQKQPARGVSQFNRTRHGSDSTDRRGAARIVAMDEALRRRIAVTVILQVRSSVSGFALPGLSKENLELLPLSAWIELAIFCAS